MSKKSIIFLIIIAVVAFGIVAILKFSSEDFWTCVNGQWVKHGNPSSSMPTFGCGDNNTSTSTDGQETESDIIVVKPKANEEISSPLEITGQARGTWYFEASFPVRLEDANGMILARSIAQAQSDWMTENFVPFKATLEFTATSSSNGQLILAKDNPSDLPANAKEIKIPVKILASSTDNMTIKVYFNNNNFDPEITCVKVFPVDRVIPRTQAVAKTAIEELLKGPSDAEKNEGYLTSINAGVKLNSISIDEGVAKADFDETMEQAIGGSCRVSAIRSQIEQTLKQFPTVQGVIISVNGRTEDILQP